MTTPFDPPGFPGAGPVVDGAPGPGAGGVDDGRLRPSGWWYGLAGLLGAVGVGLGMVMLVSAFAGSLGAVDDFPRVPVPGSRAVTLDEGEYIVYAEYPYTAQYVGSPDPYVTVYDAAGDEVPFRPSFSSSTYDVGSRHGVAMGRVDVPADGTYDVVVDEGVSDAVAVAFGDEIVLDAVLGVFGGIAVMGLGVLVGVIVAVVVGVKRGRDKRSRRPPLPPGWPGAGAPGWAPPAPGWAPPPGQGQAPGWAPPPPGQGQAPGWSPPAPGQGQPPGWAPPPSPEDAGWAAPAPAPGEGWVAPGGRDEPGPTPPP